MAGPNPIWPVSLETEGIWTQTTQRDNRVRRRPSSISHGGRPQKKSNLPTPWTQTSSLRNCEKILFCYLSHPVWGICYGSPSKWINSLINRNALPLNDCRWFDKMTMEGHNMCYSRKNITSSAAFWRQTGRRASNFAIGSSKARTLPALGNSFSPFRVALLLFFQALNNHCHQLPPQVGRAWLRPWISGFTIYSFIKYQHACSLWFSNLILEANDNGIVGTLGGLTVFSLTIRRETTFVPQFLKILS